MGNLKRTYAFEVRNSKEILRDPLNLIFGLGFPVILLLLFRAIGTNVPVDIFKIDSITPGIVVFGLSFMTLFSATLVAKDRESAFIQRLYTSPLRGVDFILGYTLPILPIAIGQCVICYILGIILGMKINVNMIFALLLSIPTAIFFIVLGLLCGSIFNVKQVGGICGALITNLTAWLSGAWFSLDLVGGWFKIIANVLPFAHGVDIQREALSGDYSSVCINLIWILCYMVIFLILSIFAFLYKMNRE